MKVLERIVDGLIRQLVSIDFSQFGFVQGRGTTDAIFLVRQLEEKHLAAYKSGIDRVPRNVIWWALRKLGVEEWIVRTGPEDVCQCHGALFMLVRDTGKSLK